MSRPETPNPSPRLLRRMKILLCFLALLIVLALAAFHYGTRWARQELLGALPPNSEIQALNLRPNGLEILGLRLPAPRNDWPTANLLSIERVLVTLSWTELLKGRLALPLVEANNLYISVMRNHSGLRILPGLAESAAPRSLAASGLLLAYAAVEPGDFSTVAYALPRSLPRLKIGRIKMTGGTLEFFDATIRKPALTFRLEQLDAELSPLRLPDFSGASQLSVVGLVKGKSRNGQLELRGDADIARQTAHLWFTLNGADLPPFQPYFIRPTDSDLSQGRLDLETTLDFTQGILKAPTRMTLSELSLGPEGSRFMQLPSSLALELLKDQKGRIDLRFEVAGNLEDPDFSLNDALRREVGHGFFRAMTRNIVSIAAGWGTGLNLEELDLPPELAIKSPQEETASDTTRAMPPSDEKPLSEKAPEPTVF